MEVGSETPGDLFPDLKRDRPDFDPPCHSRPVSSSSPEVYTTSHSFPPESRGPTVKGRRSRPSYLVSLLVTETLSSLPSFTNLVLVTQYRPSSKLSGNSPTLSHPLH